MSNEYLNQLNFVLFQLWCEVQIKAMKHATIFQGFLDPEGNIKKADFQSALSKLSIMSEFQLKVLFKFYDSLDTGMVNGQAFIEHLTNRDVVGIAQALNIKNELLPYLFHKLLRSLESKRMDKFKALFCECSATLAKSLPNFEDPKHEGGKVLIEAKKVNPMLAANLEQLVAMIDQWMTPKLSHQLKVDLVHGMSIGCNSLPSTSAWKSDAYLGLTKRVLDGLSIEEYNSIILFKDDFFEDKEWFTDMTDGEELLEALYEQERQAKLAQETQKKGKGKK